MELKLQMNTVSNRFDDYIKKNNQSNLEFQDQIKSLINRTKFETIDDFKLLTNLINEIKRESKNEFDKINKTIIEERTLSKL